MDLVIGNAHSFISLQNMKLHVQDASPAESKKHLCSAGATFCAILFTNTWGAVEQRE